MAVIHPSPVFPLSLPSLPPPPQLLQPPPRMILTATHPGCRPAFFKGPQCWWDTSEVRLSLPNLLSVISASVRLTIRYVFPSLKCGDVSQCQYIYFYITIVYHYIIFVSEFYLS